jgi:hypothetical protein
MLHPLEEMASKYRRGLVSLVLFDSGGNLESGVPRAKARGYSRCFEGRNPPKHTLLGS